MQINVEHILLVGSVLLLISIFAGKTSYKFGVPTLILFLGIGMLAGSDGIGGIYFNSPELANFIGVVALNIILFSGGLDTRWRSVKPILSEGVMLSTLGVFLTAGTVGVFTWLVSDFSLSEGLLLGSIVSSTDAPAVFSILRSKSINLKENIKPVLELESGSNDPMAYFLTITMTSIVLSGEINTWAAIMSFVLQLVLGLVGGIGFGKINTFIINKIQLDFEGLYPVLGLTLCFITYSVVSFLGGNGFLAIYIAAVIMGNAQLIHKSSLVKFFDGLAWLMQIVLFLTLGLLVFPSQMPPIMEIGLVISVFMILVARPLSVFISLAFFKMSFRGKLFVSWVGLRGAVPIVFAIYPMVAGVAKADVIFTLVFFIALLSVTIQGTTVSTMAKWLGVEEKEKVDEEANARFFDNVKSASTEVVVPSGSSIVGKKIYQIGLPASTLVVMIKRDHKYFVPSGATEIEPKDKLYIIADDATSIQSAKQLLGDT